MNPVPLENRVSQIRSTSTGLFRKAGSCRRIGGCRARNGTILIVVLVCLVVATTILFGAIEVSIRHRQQTRTEIQLEQTYWLLDAGIGAAIEKFDQAPGFSEHSFATNESLKNYTGSVDIKVTERNDSNVSLLVTAKLHGQHEHSPVTQRSRVIVLNRLQSDQNGTNENKTDEAKNDEQ